MNVDSLLSQLNNSQREAVVYCDGPQLVIAGTQRGTVLLCSIRRICNNPIF